MTLPASGPISFNAINVELGVSGTTQASLGQSSYRTLAGVASGAISMSNFYGKSNVFNGTISSNQTDLNLRAWALANGWNGTVAATITINSGVYVYATSIVNSGLTIGGSWPGGITVVNNGNIIGMGGQGGQGNVGSGNVQYSESGGPAITLNMSGATITNNGYIAGGGGGGGGSFVSYNCGGGGGAGGGAGNSGANGFPAGGAGGGPGSSGSDGLAVFSSYGKSTLWMVSGGGGGRILPGTGGAGASSGGSTGYGRGGGAGGGGSSGQGGGAGSAGGSANSAGGSITNNNVTACGGGGWGAVGGTKSASPFFNYGGTGGNAISLNGNSVTRNGSGTTYGAVA